MKVKPWWTFGQKLYLPVTLGALYLKIGFSRVELVDPQEMSF